MRKLYSEKWKREIYIGLSRRECNYAWKRDKKIRGSIVLETEIIQLRKMNEPLQILMGDIKQTFPGCVIMDHSVKQGEKIKQIGYNIDHGRRGRDTESYSVNPDDEKE